MAGRDAAQDKQWEAENKRASERMDIDRQRFGLSAKQDERASEQQIIDTHMKFMRLGIDMKNNGVPLNNVNQMLKDNGINLTLEEDPSKNFDYYKGQKGTVTWFHKDLAPFLQQGGSQEDAVKRGLIGFSDKGVGPWDRAEAEAGMAESRLKGYKANTELDYMQGKNIGEQPFNAMTGFKGTERPMSDYDRLKAIGGVRREQTTLEQNEPVGPAADQYRANLNQRAVALENMTGRGGAQTARPNSGFKSPQEVKAAYKGGQISKEQALKIIAEEFGGAL